MASKVPLDIHYIGPPFSRAYALIHGFDRARILAGGDWKNAIAFSLDDSLFLPTDMTSRITNSISCGQTVYNPKFFKCVNCEFEKLKYTPGDRGTEFTHTADQDTGFWEYSSFGMMGFCLSDYYEIGQWNKIWGYHWGCEDTDMYKRTKDKGYLVITVAEQGFIYHKELKKPKSNPYYGNNNIYGKPEPVAPLSYLVESDEFIQRLWQYVKNELAKDDILELEMYKPIKSRVFRTYADGGRAIYYTGVSEKKDNRINRINGETVDSISWTIRSNLAPVIVE